MGRFISYPYKGITPCARRVFKPIWTRLGGIREHKTDLRVWKAGFSRLLYYGKALNFSDQICRFSSGFRQIFPQVFEK